MSTLGYQYDHTVNINLFQLVHTGFTFHIGIITGQVAEDNLPLPKRNGHAGVTNYYRECEERCTLVSGDRAAGRHVAGAACGQTGIP
jgi:hypothetical protein